VRCTASHRTASHRTASHRIARRDDSLGAGVLEPRTHREKQTDGKEWKTNGYNKIKWKEKGILGR